MKTRHGIDAYYNGHIAVGSENRLITDYTLDNSANDYASVVPLAKGTRKFIDQFWISAERGHFSLPNMLSFSKEKIEVFIFSPGRGTPGKRPRVPEKD